jgi:DNA-binding Lrp family transcriptional regulator
VTVEPTVERDVLNKLKETPGVQEAHFLFGPYDTCVKIEAESSHDL